MENKAGLDAEGAVWLANPEGRYAVLGVREGGEIVERIELNTHAYAVMLGGPERRHCSSAPRIPTIRHKSHELRTLPCVLSR